MSIELKEIACYAAYGLKGIFQDEDDGTQWYEMEIDATNIEFFITDGTPLVIPIGELTDEQWIEVFKSGLPNLHRAEKDFFFIERGERFIEVKYRQALSMIKMTYRPKHQEFIIAGHGCFNQLSAFQKLFELHADVFGWIPRNLAHNKLTYK